MKRQYNNTKQQMSSKEDEKSRDLARKYKLVINEVIVMGMNQEKRKET